MKRFSYTVNGAVKSINLPDESDEVDVEDFLRIDYSNVVGECIVTPTMLNRAGIMRAECSQEVQRCKIQLSVLESSIRNEYRTNCPTQVKLTQVKLEDLVKTDPRLIAAQAKEREANYAYDLLDSFYWAMKSKDKKLELLLHKLSPTEVEGFQTTDTNVSSNLQVKVHHGKQEQQSQQTIKPSFKSAAELRAHFNTGTADAD
jgi:hypothetical protein